MIWQQQNNSDALKQYYKNERSVLEVQIYDSLRVTPGHDQPRVWMWVMAFEKKKYIWMRRSRKYVRRMSIISSKAFVLPQMKAGRMEGNEVSTSLLTIWITTVVRGPQWLHGSSGKSRLYRSVNLRRIRQLYKARRVVLHDGKRNKD